MADGSAGLQQAIYTALTGGEAPVVSVDVYSCAPQDAALPFVDIAESDTLPADVQGRDGLEETVTIHVWTVFGDQLQAKGIISAIRGALHLKPLTVTGRDSAFCTVTGTRIFPDADNESLHGVITLRVNHYGTEEP